MTHDDAVKLVKDLCTAVAAWQIATTKGRSAKTSEAKARKLAKKMLLWLVNWPNRATDITDEDVDLCLSRVGLV